MTQPSHSPEPWATSEDGFVDADNCLVGGYRGHDAHDCYSMESADISRILVCINACKGIPNEILESVIEADKESGRSMIQEALELVVHMHVNKINRQALEAGGDA